MYKVVKAFYDLRDNDRFYAVGDKFPHGDFAVSADRIKELSGTGNRLGEPLIRKVSEPKKASKKTTEK